MAISRDDLGTIEQGETAHRLQHEFQDAEGLPLDLTSATSPEVRMVERDTGIVVLDWADASIPAAAIGVVQRLLVADDVATAGSYYVQFRYTRADGTVDYSPPLTLEIRANP